MPGAGKPFEKGDPRAALGKTAWKPGGGSPNPGGRCKVAVAFAANNTSAREVTAEAMRCLLDAMRKLDPGDKDESASWRFAVDRLLAYTVGKPKDRPDGSDDGDEDAAPALDLSDVSDEELRVLMKIGLHDPSGN